MSHNNGEMMEPSVHSREKHHHTRVMIVDLVACTYLFVNNLVFFQDKSPYTRERERSHDRTELRDKQYPFHV